MNAHDIFSNETFAIFNASEREKLLTGAIPVSYDIDTDIFMQGDTIDYYYYVLSGAVKIYRLNIHGDEYVMNVLPRGQMVAHIANFLSPRVYPVSAAALKHTQLLRLNAKIFVDIVTKNHQASLAFMAEMTARIYTQIDYIETLKNNSAIERVKAFLLTTPGNIQGNDKHITVHSTQRVLAQQLSLTPESLSRTLNTMKKSNTISVSSDGFILHNVHDLLQEQAIFE